KIAAVLIFGALIHSHPTRDRLPKECINYASILANAYCAACDLPTHFSVSFILTRTLFV
ncbi:hypothetical protein KXV77_009061, partial [Aspergillus fumigatus]